MNPEDVIWEGTVDNNTWACKVVGTSAQYLGVLTVTRVRDGKIIFREPIRLSYGARFGPDVADVALWQEMCIAAIDGQPPEDIHLPEPEEQP